MIAPTRPAAPLASFLASFLAPFLLPLALSLLAMTHTPAAAATAASVSIPAAVTLDHVEPPDWWVGMKSPELQVMLHGAGIGALQVALAPAPGVTLVGTRRGDSPNYLFVDLRIAPTAQPGTLTLQLQHEGRTVLEHRYPLRARAAGSAQRESFGPKDAIYLVVPDRFANGDPRNDEVPGMAEGLRRDDPGGRHGGDLAGLTAHLDYIAGMGFTMLWPTPLSENNSPKWSYHGYAATDFYKVDARFGTNADFMRLATEAKRHGLGLIQDIVLNHIGVHHWWMADLPTADWVNVWPRYTETHHARMSLQDPYAAPSDRKRFSDGWFTPDMPDLNQRQPLVATYLTQMSLWWIESAGLAGVRTDTYSYSDKDFLAAQISFRLDLRGPALLLDARDRLGTELPLQFLGKAVHRGIRKTDPGPSDDAGRVRVEDVLVRQDVRGVQRERPLEGAQRLADVAEGVGMREGARVIVEVRLPKLIPGLDVARVAGDETTHNLARARQVAGRGGGGCGTPHGSGVRRQSLAHR